MGGQTRLSRGAFYHVETELYAYFETKKEIIRLRNEILYGSAPPDETGVRGSLPSDPTGQRAMMLAHRKIEQLERIVNAIDTVVSSLPPEKQKLVRLRYWAKPRTLTWDGIARVIPAHRATVLRWRNEIVRAIAELIGWR